MTAAVVTECPESFALSDGDFGWMTVCAFRPRDAFGDCPGEPLSVSSAWFDRCRETCPVCGWPENVDGMLDCDCGGD
jgi:hypothetical protein